jgi:hypothetical protein
MLKYIPTDPRTPKPYTTTLHLGHGMSVIRFISDFNRFGKASLRAMILSIHVTNIQSTVKAGIGLRSCGVTRSLSQ